MSSRESIASEVRTGVEEVERDDRASAVTIPAARPPIAATTTTTIIRINAPLVWRNTPRARARTAPVPTAAGMPTATPITNPVGSIRRRGGDGPAIVAMSGKQALSLGIGSAFDASLTVGERIITRLFTPPGSFAAIVRCADTVVLDVAESTTAAARSGVHLLVGLVGVDEPVADSGLGDEAGRPGRRRASCGAGWRRRGGSGFRSVLGSPNLFEDHPVGVDAAWVGGEQSRKANSLGVSVTGVPATSTRWWARSMRRSPTSVVGVDAGSWPVAVMAERDT